MLNFEPRGFGKSLFALEVRVKEVGTGKGRLVEVPMVEMGGNREMDLVARHLFPVLVEIIEFTVEVIVGTGIEDGALDPLDRHEVADATVVERLPVLRAE